MRINKYLSQIGICSRREADKLVHSGRIKVNNEIAILGTKIKETDKITIDNKLIKPKKKKTIFIAFNKPKGVVCTTNRLIEKNNIIDYINFPERIFPVGRLDKLSEGLIFLTNDGSLVNKVLRSRNNKEKEYLVEVNKNITRIRMGFRRLLYSILFIEELAKILYSAFRKAIAPSS